MENLCLEEKGKRFDIFFSEKKNEVVIQGKTKDFTEGNKESTQLKKMLYLFLLKVGSYVEFAELGEIIWGDQCQKSSDIHQLRDRLIKFTSETIKPFIKPGKSLIGRSDRYYIKESFDGSKFKYCMILRKNSVNLSEE